jgi:hypothetical protein
LFQHGLNEFNSLNESEIYMNIYFHLSLLKHAFKAKKTCTFSTLNITARGGNISCLKYAHEVIKANSNDYLLINAAESGSLKCLKYTFCVIKATSDEHILSAAAGSGSLSCLKYTHKVIKATNDLSVISSAAESGSLVCLKYAHKVIKATDFFVLFKFIKNISCIEYYKNHIIKQTYFINQ